MWPRPAAAPVRVTGPACGHGGDVALVDLRMPRMDGVQAARRITAESGCDTAVVMLTTFDADEHVLEALRAGATGFCSSRCRASSS